MKQYWSKSVFRLLSLVIAVTTVNSCEEVIPYPDTGATEMMYIEGAAGSGVSRFSVRRIFPISEKTFVSQKEKTLLEASMRLTVNGKEVPVTCFNDSLVCDFSTEYTFQAKDRISVDVSAPGVPDVKCETTVPDLPEVKDVSYNLLDNNTLDFNATVRIHPQMMDGYVYFLEKEENKITYIDGIFASETTEIMIQCLQERDFGTKTIYYRYYPVTGYEDADDDGMHHLSSNVELSTSYEMPDEEGRIVRTESTVRRIRFCAWHLSTALYMGLKTKRKNQDYDPDSTLSFMTPLEHSNVTGGKGYVGAVSTYQSEWREL